MSDIHVLDKNTINQIAAGEVVERPASIVKELVENSVDAGSSAITIEIKGGGIDFIRVTDNGIGIEEGQIRKAFLRHATSKIQSAEDLEEVRSLGFRGEALSSISAVSRVELITKTGEGIAGIRYQAEGGEELSFEEVGCPEGTTFVVRNLFYNTPARRKFLKTAMTEAGYVESFVQRLALSHPEISFTFISDHKNKLATSGNGNLKDAIYHIFGREIARNLLPVEHADRGIQISGFVGKPVISRGNRNFENYFVGGRYLKNPVIARGIEEGFKGRSMVHKFPFTVLMIDMEPRFYDVNVHPAKMEMRFKNAEDLYAVLVEAIRKAFEKKELIPEVSLGKEPEKSQNAGREGFVYGKEEETGKGTAGVLTGAGKGTAGAATGAGKTVLRPEPFEKERRSRLEKERRPEQLSLWPERPDFHGQGNVAGQSRLSGSSGLMQETRSTDLNSQGSAVDQSGDVRERMDGDQGEGSLVREPEGYMAPQPQDTVPPLFLSGEGRKEHRIIGQVFGTFWLVEYREKLFFVDQHAAHEKVMYERLMKNLREKRADSQMVAPPAIISLSMREKNRYLICRDAFAALGYQVEDFGEDALVIRAVPANLYDLDQQALFLDLLDGIDEGKQEPDLTAITDHLATMACKAAVKGNSRMTEREMDRLLDQLLSLDHPYQCPHGRPTIISMTRYELEKKFKRIQ